MGVEIRNFFILFFFLLFTSMKIVLWLSMDLYYTYTGNKKARAYLNALKIPELLFEAG